MGNREPSFTFGIEEEYHLVDLVSRGFAAAPADMMRECEEALGKQVAPEFFRSQIEIGTSVHKDFKTARKELAGLRRTIAEITGKYAIAPIAASTHPFADRSTLETTPKARYQALSGMLMLVLGRMPQTGDTIVWESWKLEVVDMDGKRIDKVLATPVSTTPAPTAEMLEPEPE